MVLDFLNQFGPISSPNQQFPSLRVLPFKYLGLYFTATWCSSCVRTAPQLKRAVQKIQEVHPGTFKMVAVRLDEDQSNFGYYFWRFPKLNLNEANKISHFLQVKYLPTILIINQKGKVISKNGLHDIISYKQKAIQHWDKTG